MAKKKSDTQAIKSEEKVEAAKVEETKVEEAVVETTTPEEVKVEETKVEKAEVKEIEVEKPIIEETKVEEVEVEKGATPSVVREVLESQKGDENSESKDGVVINVSVKSEGEETPEIVEYPKNGNPRVLKALSLYSDCESMYIGAKGNLYAKDNFKDSLDKTAKLYKNPYFKK